MLELSTTDLAAELLRYAQTAEPGSQMRISPRVQLLIKPGQYFMPIHEVYVGFQTKTEAARFAKVAARSRIGIPREPRKAEVVQSEQVKWEVCVSNLQLVWAAKLAVLDKQAIDTERALTSFLDGCVSQESITKPERTKMLSSIRRSSGLQKAIKYQD